MPCAPFAPSTSLCAGRIQMSRITAAHLDFDEGAAFRQSNTTLLELNRRVHSQTVFAVATPMNTYSNSAPSSDP
ncbi:hypothetical protein C8R45DRAFT_1216487 [Mycena sanguinolenta]|nr:hypothetical protein C8R45DRAFT_1216487 [Mycena sanguinolenta]